MQLFAIVLAAAGGIHQVAAPPRDIVSGIVRLPDPASAPSTSRAAILPVRFRRVAGVGWTADLEVPVDRSGPLSLALLSPDAGSWKLTPGAPLAFDRTLSPAGDAMPGWTVDRYETSIAAPGTLALRVDAAIRARGRRPGLAPREDLVGSRRRRGSRRSRRSRGTISRSSRADLGRGRVETARAFVEDRPGRSSSGWRPRATGRSVRRFRNPSAATCAACRTPRHGRERVSVPRHRPDGLPRARAGSRARRGSARRGRRRSPSRGRDRSPAPRAARSIPHLRGGLGHDLDGRARPRVLDLAHRRILHPLARRALDRPRRSARALRIARSPRPGSRDRRRPRPRRADADRRRRAAGRGQPADPRGRARHAHGRFASREAGDRTRALAHARPRVLLRRLGLARGGLHAAEPPSSTRTRTARTTRSRS